MRVESPTVTESSAMSEVRSDISTEIQSSESVSASEADVQGSKSSWLAKLNPEVRIFLSTFLTIFLAELGDKTQVTTLLITAESHSPWIVFAGAGSALVATSLIGVWLGHWLSRRISARTLEVAAAVMLLLIAGLLGWDIMRG